VIVGAECLLSGLLGLYVGLDYIPRLPGLRRWFQGFEVFHALLAQARPTDLLQDYGGARALLFGGNAYEPTGALAQRYVTVSYTSLSYVSTHPPTAFLLLLPIAAFPLGVASAIWVLLMLGGLVACVRICGAPWHVAALLGPLLVLIPPLAEGVNQLAVAVLVLVFLAYRLRERPFMAGVLIGLASLAKYLPALLLVPFVTRRQWSAVVGFALTWVCGLTAIVLLNTDALPAYLSSGQVESATWIAEPSNGAFLVVALRYGMVATVLAVALVLWILWCEARDRSADSRLRWARWNWLAVALLPITWSFSVLPLALSAVVLLHRRDTLATLVALMAFAPLIFTQISVSPLPAFVCIAGVGVALAVQRLTSQSGLLSNRPACQPL
jgi:hypothetical protein